MPKEKKSSKKKEKKTLPPWLNKDKDKDDKEEEEVEEAMTLTANERIKEYQKKEKDKKKKKDLKESRHKKGKKGKKGKGKMDAGKLYPVLDSNQINIVKFIKCMNEKNYAKANKYLQAVLENKMKARMASGI